MKSSRWIRCAAVLTGLALLPSCSTRIVQPDRMPSAVRIHDVGPYLQEPEQCGPFALWALLRYLGIEADRETLVQKLYSSGAGGTLTMDLYLEARRRGLEARQLSGSADILAGELQEHHPVIVLLKYPGLRRSAGHFILVTGFSSDPSGFFLLWGDGRLSWMGVAPFQRLWSNSGWWMLTVREDGS